MIGKERPVAAFAPSLRSIKLYRSGRIDYQGKSGSIIGATARVYASGSREGFRRDTREVVLSIEGPGVAIAAPLPVNGVQAHRAAREFAAAVNEMATELAEPTAAPTAPPSPRGSSSAELFDLLERLAGLRDSGVLTEDEFQAQKAALLRSMKP